MFGQDLRVRELRPFVESVVERALGASDRERDRLEGILRVTQLDLEYLLGEARKGNGIAETVATQELLIEAISLGYQSIECLIDYLDLDDPLYLAKSLELVQTSDDVLLATRDLIEQNKTQLSRHSMV